VCFQQIGTNEIVEKNYNNYGTMCENPQLVIMCGSHHIHDECDQCNQRNSHGEISY